MAVQSDTPGPVVHANQGTPGDMSAACGMSVDAAMNHRETMASYVAMAPVLPTSP